MESWLAYPLLTVVGIVAGALNVVAGGGSFLTLPALIFFGLPPTLANGTNRVAIVLQNLTAGWGFNREGVLDRSALFWACVPATLGAVLGTALALRIGDQAFQRVLAFLMVAVTLWTLLSQPNPDPARSPSTALLAVGFFFVGAYGGFVQAGVGFFILAALSYAGFDLVRGNAIKVVSIFCFSLIALVIFAWQGQVAWAPGLALAVGNSVGGLLGVRLTVLKGHTWIQRVVTIAIVVFAIQLWITS